MMNQLMNVYDVNASFTSMVFWMLVVIWLTSVTHELFHALFAYTLGFKINKISLGFGPKLYDSEKLSIGILPAHFYVDWEPYERKVEDNLKIAAVFSAGVLGNIIWLTVGLLSATEPNMFAFIAISLNALLVITNILPIIKANDGSMVIKAISCHYKNELMPE